MVLQSFRAILYVSHQPYPAGVGSDRNGNQGRHSRGFDFRGTLQAGRLRRLDELFHDGSIVGAGCNTHARRRFKDAHDL